MREQTIQNRARLALSENKLGVYWRANVGRAWTSNEVYQIKHPGQAASFRLEVGDMILRDARPFSTGLPEGFSDLFGATMLTVTPDMVGKTIAVYTGLEAKGPRGKATDKQEMHLAMVRRAGGIAGVFRSPDEAVEIVRAGPQV